MFCSVCNWEDGHECPPVSRRWKNIADEAAVKISEKIANLLDGWQRQHGILHLIDKEIITVFTNEFGLLQHQVDDIEGMHCSHCNGSQLFTEWNVGLGSDMGTCITVGILHELVNSVYRGNKKGPLLVHSFHREGRGNMISWF